MQDFLNPKVYTKEEILGGAADGKNLSTMQRTVEGGAMIEVRRYETAMEYTQQRFIPSSEKYVSPATKGKVTFDYSNNDGKYSIGSGTCMFETSWSKASDRRIYTLRDPPSIRTVALVKDKQEISSIDDARVYDGSSRFRTPNVGQIVLIQDA